MFVILLIGHLHTIFLNIRSIVIACPASEPWNGSINRQRPPGGRLRLSGVIWSLNCWRRRGPPCFVGGKRKDKDNRQLHKNHCKGYIFGSHSTSLDYTMKQPNEAQ